MYYNIKTFYTKNALAYLASLYTLRIYTSLAKESLGFIPNIKLYCAGVFCYKIWLRRQMRMIRKPSPFYSVIIYFESIYVFSFYVLLVQRVILSIDTGL